MMATEPIRGRCDGHRKIKRGSEDGEGRRGRRIRGEDRFCRMDAEGRQLDPDGQREMDGLLQYQRLLTQYSEIAVVKDYFVGRPEMRGDTARLSVDYSLWGSLDSSLRFSHFESSADSSPPRPILSNT
jgi:hypothetical protein